VQPQFLKSEYVIGSGQHLFIILLVHWPVIFRTTAPYASSFSARVCTWDYSTMILLLLFRICCVVSMCAIARKELQLHENDDDWWLWYNYINYMYMQEEKHMRWKEKVWRMKMAAHLHLSMYLSQCELDSPQYVRRLRWDETAKIMTCHNLCSSVRILLPNGRVAKMESLHSTLLLSTFFPFVCHLVFIMQRTYILHHGTWVCFAK